MTTLLFPRSLSHATGFLLKVGKAGEVGKEGLVLSPNHEAGNLYSLIYEPYISLFHLYISHFSFIKLGLTTHALPLS